jgi:hypothetical protein
LTFGRTKRRRRSIVRTFGKRMATFGLTRRRRNSSGSRFVSISSC